MSFDATVKAIASGFAQFSLLDAVDILIIAVILYHVIKLTKQTRAYQVLKGFAMLLIAAAASQIIGLMMINWLLSSLLKSGLLLAVVLFQPELRRALEQMGRGKLFDNGLFKPIEPMSRAVVEEVHRTVMNLAKRRIGALIVIEQRTGLGDIIATGTRIEGRVTSALLENIFVPNTPLHDGAAVLRGSEVAAAACILPLSDDITIARDLGTRHRAALGVSSVSDSITLVVSEETGIVSIARDGKLVRYIDSKALRDVLESVYLKAQSNGVSLSWLKRRKNGKAG